MTQRIRPPAIALTLAVIGWAPWWLVAPMMIRDAIVADPGLWKNAVGQRRFKEFFTLQGESLKRPPRGYDPNHPLIEVLKMKDFTGYAPLTQKQVTDPGFVKDFAKLCKTSSPLVEFLCDAIGVPF